MLLSEKNKRIRGLIAQALKELEELNKQTQETFDKINEPPPLFPDWEEGTEPLKEKKP